MRVHANDGIPTAAKERLTEEGFKVTTDHVPQEAVRRDRQLEPVAIPGPGGALDRQAVGTELRYLDQQKSGFLTVDYDIHFQQLNAAIASGSWTFSDKSVLHLGGDYRKAPYMTAWNALQGQPFATLYDMLKVRTKQEVDQLALDRTPTYQSATIGYSYPLTEKLQASLDVTAANMSGTVASGGVDAMLPMGTEYYLNAQLIANGLFSEGDLYIGALRFADKEHSDLYVVDLSARYPMTREFRVNPRLRLGYEVGKDTDLQEYTLLPSLLLNYYWTKDFVLELEIAVQLFAFFGFREFIRRLCFVFPGSFFRHTLFQILLPQHLRARRDLHRRVCASR